MAGALAALLWGGMLGLGGWWAAGHGFRQPDGLPRAIGAAVLAWTWATLGALALGVAGHLSRGPLLAWAAAGPILAGLIRMLMPAPPAGHALRREPLDGAATLGLALILWGIAFSGFPAWFLPEKTASDAPIYHLYFAAQWWKSGRLSIVPAPFGDTAVSYFPANGEVLYAAMMAVLDGDALARAGPFLLLILAAASAYSIARRLGAGPSAATLAVGLFVSAPPVLFRSFMADVDVLFIAGYLAAADCFLAYARREGDAGTLALGGLAAGLAWGTKATGTVFVPPLLAVAALAVLARGGPRTARLGHLLLLVLSSALTAGYWFARNAWLMGNPLYPLQVSALGRVWLPGWFESIAMRRSQFYIPPRKLHALADILLNVVDPRVAPLWAAGLLAAAFPRRGRPDDRWTALVAALAVANVGLYWIIPYRSQQRFVMPAIGLASAPLACLLDRSRWLRWTAAGLLFLHLLTPSIWPFAPLGRETPWGFTGALTNPATGPVPAIPVPSMWQAVRGWSDLVVMIGLPVATGLLALPTAILWTSAIRDPAPRRWICAAIAASALAALPSFAGWYQAMRFQADFPIAPLHRAWDRLDRLAGARPARIAYAGTNLAYYLMGRGQRHDVVYVNIDAHRGWRLHDYHREAMARGEPNWPDPRPGWDRIHPDYDAWLANLAADRIDLLFVARPDPTDGRFNIADPEGYPIERLWADTHPEAFTLVRGPADGDRYARIYRVHPPGGSRSGADRRPEPPPVTGRIGSTAIGTEPPPATGPPRSSSWRSRLRPAIFSRASAAPTNGGL